MALPFQMKTSKPTHLILSTVFMTIGLLAFGIQTAVACVMCAEECEVPYLTAEEHDRVEQAAAALASAGGEQVITELIYDSINHHASHGDTADTAITHLEQTMSAYGF